MKSSSLIQPNADGTFTVADIATVLTEEAALGLLNEIVCAVPTSSPSCAMDRERLSHRWERLA